LSKEGEKRENMAEKRSKRHGGFCEIKSVILNESE